MRPPKGKRIYIAISEDLTTIIRRIAAESGTKDTEVVFDALHIGVAAIQFKLAEKAAEKKGPNQCG